MNGRPFPVAGVMPRNFHDVERDYYSPPDVWLSFHALYTEQLLLQQRTAGSRTIARLRPGVTLDEARAHLKVLAPQISTDPRDPYHLQDIDVRPVRSVQIGPWFRESTIDFLGILMTVCILILLAACFSVASFLVAKGSSRRPEMAIRMAMGATRSRIVRQLLTESLLLGAAAAAAGLLTAAWFLQLVPRMPVDFTRMPLDVGFSLSLESVGFAMSLMLTCCLLFGLIPALVTSTGNPYANLRNPRPRWSWSGFRITTRQVLLVVQVALAVILAVTAGLYARSLARIARMQPGYPAESMLLARINPQAIGAERIPLFYRTLLDHLNRRPDVVSASIGWNPPFSIGSRVVQLVDDPAVQVRAGSTAVAPGYFATLGVPVIAGREFDGSEGEDAGALIINRVLAEQLWPGQNPVGKSTISGMRFDERRIVVGVVDMPRCSNLLEEKGPCAWISFPWNSGSGYLRIRTLGDPMAFLPDLRRAIRDIEPDVAIASASSLTDHLLDLTAPQRVTAKLTGMVAVLGIVLVAIGCFSLIASMVRDSRRELAIRIAMGASARTLTLRIAMSGLVLGFAGTVLGLAASVPIVERYLADQLFEIAPRDTLTFIVVGAGIIVICVLASYLPARAAATMDPSLNLRHE